MLVETSQEKKDKKIAMAVSVIFHALLVLLFFFIMAWRAPNPPLEEYGIEVNFGMDATGSGDLQTTAQANESTNREDSRPALTTPEPAKPEVQPKPTPPAAQPQAQEALAAENDNPVVFKKVEEKPTPEPPKEEVKVVKSTPEPPKEEVKVVEKPKALYPGKTKADNTGNGTAGTSNKATGNNNGNDGDAVGDKGDPNGKLDAKSLYGKPGGGGGASLNMPGWNYDVQPKQDPYENEAGKIVFRITIDANGDIENISTIESNVSPQVVKWYRDQVFKTTFSRTSSKAANDQGASGTITFIIRSR